MTTLQPHAITIRWRDLGTAFVLGLLAWSVNEFVFFEVGPSALVRWSVVPFFFAALWHSRWLAARMVIFLGIALHTRPRGVHLIPLADRGAYAYYSPNSAGLAGLDVSLTTFLMALPLLYLFAPRPGRAWLLKRPEACILVALILWGFAGSLTSGLASGVFEPARVLSDLKYPLLMFTGYLLVARVPGLAAPDIARFLVWVGLVVAFSTAASVLLDLVLGRFLLSYNTAVFFSIGAMTILLRLGNFRRTPTLIAAILLIVSSFPLTRGEQLVFGLNGILLLGFAARALASPSRAGRLLLVAGLAVMVSFVTVGSVAQQSPATRAFFLSKLELFRSLGAVQDKSTLVRIAEWESIVDMREPQRLPALVFGRGFGAAFSFSDRLRRLGLDNADYSPQELATARGYQPHLFVSYWLLKFGLAGTALLVGLHITALFRLPPVALLTYVAFLFPVLWQGYWVPVYALLTGLLFAAGTASTAVLDGVDQSRRRNGRAWRSWRWATPRHNPLPGPARPSGSQDGVPA